MASGKAAARQQVSAVEIVSPPPAAAETPQTSSASNSVIEDERNLTINTKLSQDQLILCKSPQQDPCGKGVADGNVAVAMNRKIKRKMKDKDGGARNDNLLVYLSLVEIFFGILMCTFGVLAIINASSLSQLGAGIWGGLLSISAGVSGIVATAKVWCPLRSHPLKVAQTVHLTLNLITFAIVQLVVVIAAIGIARDVHNLNENTLEIVDNVEEVLPYNYGALLANCLLMVIASLSCLCTMVCSYKSARIVCPCFVSNAADDKKSLNGNLHDNMCYGGGRNALVHTWLGKQSSNSPPIYVLQTAPSTLSSRHSKASGGFIYPLIPAPLGQIPPPPPQSLITEDLHQYRRHYRQRSPDSLIYKQKMTANSSSGSTKNKKSKKPKVTTEEVVKTYTGLDRAIADQFIEICDSKQNSLCSSSSLSNQSNQSDKMIHL